MATFLDRLTPDEYVSSVYDIDLDRLWHAGKRLILTDLDNTLVPWNVPQAPARLLDWLQQAQSRGFKVCIVSNNEGARVAAFAHVAGLDALGAAKKPRPDAFLQAMRQHACSPSQTVMVGDQLFTDVRGARRVGVHSILVLPLDPAEWWPTRLVRLVEGLVLRRLVNQGRLVHPRQPRARGPA